ncbi:peptidase U32 family protein [Brevibacillus ginsengisoli]|uniref:peptidase U32 family protein n=1 Tax=Brevibacillus ginsengisoli TaxID=363854 RepID=UPI003CFB0A5E
MKKPELLVSAKSFASVVPLLDAGADALSIGDARYGLRNAGDFTIEEINQTVKIAHERGAKVYVNVNALLHNDELNGLEEYLGHLDSIGVDGIVFGDPSVLLTAREVTPNLKLHWSMEMLSTSFDTVNYWASKGATRAVLARELTIDETIENRENSAIEIQAQIHGATCIFHSRRDLVTAYFGYQGRDVEQESTGMERGLYMKEEKRQTVNYPIYEDAHGTHVMSAEDICMIDGLEDFINGGIDSLKIEGLLQTEEYILTVTKLYRRAIDLCLTDVEAYRDQAMNFLDQIEAIQPANRPLNTGFYYKPPIPYQTS